MVIAASEVPVTLNRFCPGQRSADKRGVRRLQAMQRGKFVKLCC